MTRILRLEYPGALYHVTSRGNAGQPIFFSDRDRETWLGLLALTCLRFNFTVFAYCQMTNHFHLMVETPDGNLSRGMRHLNSRYSQYVNKKRGCKGHVLQGRYKAILVQKESYLLELARYIVLNPVRAGMVEQVGQWAWSSYHPTIEPDMAPSWLDAAWLLAQFDNQTDAAIVAYRMFVEDGHGRSSPLDDTRYQLVLGDASFVKQHGDRLDPTDCLGCNREQRRLSSLSLEGYAAKYTDRNEAMAFAYLSTNFTMLEIARYFGVSAKTVERAVKRMNDDN